MANVTTHKGVDFHVGDKIRVYQKIQEGGKTRVQPFEGIVLAIKGGGETQSFCVRKIAAAKIGVERIWSTNSPWIEKIEVMKHGIVRRAKLYYARDPKVKLKFTDDQKTAESRPVRRKSSSKKAAK